MQTNAVVHQLLILGTGILLVSAFNCPPGIYNSLVADPGNCNRYFHCLSGRRFFPRNCPSGLRFDPRHKICNWPSLVACGKTTVEDRDPWLKEKHNIADPFNIKPYRSVNINFNKEDKRGSQLTPIGANIQGVEEEEGNHFDASSGDVDIDTFADKSIVKVSRKNKAMNNGPAVKCQSSFSFISDPERCEVFYQCYMWIPVPKVCPKGLYFDHFTLVCNWPHLVNCIRGKRRDLFEQITVSKKSKYENSITRKQNIPTETVDEEEFDGHLNRNQIKPSKQKHRLSFLSRGQTRKNYVNTNTTTLMRMSRENPNNPFRRMNKFLKDRKFSNLNIPLFRSTMFPRRGTRVSMIFAGGKDSDEDILRRFEMRRLDEKLYQGTDSKVNMVKNKKINIDRGSQEKSEEDPEIVFLNMKDKRNSLLTSLNDITFPTSTETSSMAELMSEAVTNRPERDLFGERSDFELFKDTEKLRGDQQRIENRDLLSTKNSTFKISITQVPENMVKVSKQTANEQRQRVNNHRNINRSVISKENIRGIFESNREELLSSLIAKDIIPWNERKSQNTTDEDSVELHSVNMSELVEEIALTHNNILSQDDTLGPVNKTNATANEQLLQRSPQNWNKTTIGEQQGLLLVCDNNGTTCKKQNENDISEDISNITQDINARKTNDSIKTLAGIEKVSENYQYIDIRPTVVLIAETGGIQRDESHDSDLVNKINQTKFSKNETIINTTLSRDTNASQNSQQKSLNSLSINEKVNILERDPTHYINDVFLENDTIARIPKSNVIFDPLEIRLISFNQSSEKENHSQIIEEVSMDHSQHEITLVPSTAETVSTGTENYNQKIDKKEVPMLLLPIQNKPNQKEVERLLNEMAESLDVIQPLEVTNTYHHLGHTSSTKNKVNSVSDKTLRTNENSIISDHELGSVVVPSFKTENDSPSQNYVRSETKKKSFDGNNDIIEMLQWDRLAIPYRSDGNGTGDLDGAVSWKDLDGSNSTLGMEQNVAGTDSNETVLVNSNSDGRTTSSLDTSILQTAIREISQDNTTTKHNNTQGSQQRTSFPRSDSSNQLVHHYNVNSSSVDADRKRKITSGSSRIPSLTTTSAVKVSEQMDITSPRQQLTTYEEKQTVVSINSKAEISSLTNTNNTSAILTDKNQKIEDKSVRLVKFLKSELGKLLSQSTGADKRENGEVKDQTVRKKTSENDITLIFHKDDLSDSNDVTTRDLENPKSVSTTSESATDRTVTTENGERKVEYTDIFNKENSSLTPTGVLLNTSLERQELESNQGEELVISTNQDSSVLRQSNDTLPADAFQSKVELIESSNDYGNASYFQDNTEDTTESADDFIERHAHLLPNSSNQIIELDQIDAVYTQLLQNKGSNVSKDLTKEKTSDVIVDYLLSTEISENNMNTNFGKSNFSDRMVVPTVTYVYVFAFTNESDGGRNLSSEVDPQTVTVYSTPGDNNLNGQTTSIRKVRTSALESRDKQLIRNHTDSESYRNSIKELESNFTSINETLTDTLKIPFNNSSEGLDQDGIFVLNKTRMDVTQIYDATSVENTSTILPSEDFQANENNISKDDADDLVIDQNHTIFDVKIRNKNISVINSEVIKQLESNYITETKIYQSFEHDSRTSLQRARKNKNSFNLNETISNMENITFSRDIGNGEDNSSFIVDKPDMSRNNSSRHVDNKENRSVFKINLSNQQESVVENRVFVGDSSSNMFHGNNGTIKDQMNNTDFKQDIKINSTFSTDVIYDNGTGKSHIKDIINTDPAEAKGIPKDRTNTEITKENQTFNLTSELKNEESKRIAFSPNTSTVTVVYQGNTSIEDNLEIIPKEYSFNETSAHVKNNSDVSGDLLSRTDVNAVSRPNILSGQEDSSGKRTTERNRDSQNNGNNNNVTRQPLPKTISKNPFLNSSDGEKSYLLGRQKRQIDTKDSSPNPDDKNNNSRRQSRTGDKNQNKTNSSPTFLLSLGQLLMSFLVTYAVR